MRFHPTSIEGAFVIEQERRGDERGFFARQFCAREMEEAGLPAAYVQVNNSLSAECHTLRGMHYQVAPHEETKLVRCIAGSLHDVVLDLRPGSPTFGQHHAELLTAANRLMLSVPKGCAHGFLTLAADTEALYFVDSFYAPGAEQGVRWDDPHFGIEWPVPPAVISDKDQGWPDHVI